MKKEESLKENKEEYTQLNIFDVLEPEEPKKEVRKRKVSTSKKNKVKEVAIEENATESQPTTEAEEKNIKVAAVLRDYEKIVEGTMVKNVCNNKVYKVVKPSLSNIVEVFDQQTGYHTLARADIVVENTIPE
jgi:hypothetical protein